MLYAAAFRRLYISNDWRWGIEPVAVTIGPALSASVFLWLRIGWEARSPLSGSYRLTAFEPVNVGNYLSACRASVARIFGNARRRS
jgi:hypothetical protein